MAFPVGAVPGVDVSHYQAVIDWEAVAGAGKLFAYAKATEGTNNTDAYFHDNWAAIKQAGMLRGAYHFFHADQDPAKQAENFLTALAETNGSPLLGPGNLPPTLDLEITGKMAPADILAAAAIWLGLVETATGRTPILYTFYSFWMSTLGNPQVLSEYPLWIARYTNAPTPGKIGAWPAWTLWQYSATQQVDGIGGQVDADAFQGTAEDLNALAGL